MVVSKIVIIGLIVLNFFAFAWGEEYGRRKEREEQERLKNMVNDMKKKDYADNMEGSEHE